MTVHDFAATAVDGTTHALSDFRGRVLLVVNVASQCGFTPQYAGLETLQQRFHARGFDVLAFPCNQFGGQEPGTEAQIAEFCETRFHTTFPLFAKVDVKGPDAHPLWRHLVAERPGLLGTETVKWNFTKFLVGRDGHVLQRYAPMTAPADIAADIERALGT